MSGFFHLMDLKKAKQAFETQKSGAARRGIEWQLTFVAWLEWWGDDLDQRGARWDNLQMQRVNDSGPYALWNIEKGTPIDNAATRRKMHPKPVHSGLAGGSWNWRQPEHEDGMPDLGYSSVYKSYGIG